MSKISEIDRNLAVRGKIEGVELCFRNARQEPFAVYGLLPGGEHEPFRRIPQQTAQAVNEGVLALHTNTAGGRVRFQTDSACVAIRAKMPEKCLMPHMTFLGSSGFDLYLTEGTACRYAGSFMPPVDRMGGYESMIRFPDRALRDVTINFPLYDAVDELFIGLEPGAALQSGGRYRTEQPVIYYGSSITQGGCASRPGNSYQAVISRMLDCDYRNLGWSGSARGERVMAEYIAAQPMSLFFMDYDHNSPSAEHLAQTHEAFFLSVREKNPDLPVILASKTDLPLSSQAARERDERRRIVSRTYENALRRGDRNVRLIDGGTVFSCLEAQGLTADSCTVDGCHPNDLGFLCMAQVFGREIGEMLGRQQHTAP
ncbi:MAG: SGNH/GDSL hydrolase family protein [Firmicutes bacterium]|nr:SGNH/GDSL hydrolase family protein [Bacillota bacterium]